MPARNSENARPDDVCEAGALAGLYKDQSMSRVGSMVLSPRQAHNVEEAESKGHQLAQVSATTFYCEGCEVTSRIGDAAAAQPFDEHCGVLYGVTGDYEGVFFF